MNFDHKVHAIYTLENNNFLRKIGMSPGALTLNKLYPLI
jgi:hypothetical protein